MTERPDWSVIGNMMAGLRNATSQIPRIQRESMKITGVAWSDDGLIKAVVGPRGQLLELDLDPRIFRKPDSKALSAAILATVRNAVEEAMTKHRELIDEALPSDLRPGKIGGMAVEELMKSDDATLLAKGEKDDG